MKACILQPPYSEDLSHSDEYFDYKLKMLDRCDESADIIVLPEYSDVPCAAADREELFLTNAWKRQNGAKRWCLLMHFMKQTADIATQHMFMIKKAPLSGSILKNTRLLLSLRRCIWMQAIPLHALNLIL